MKKKMLIVFVIIAVIIIGVGGKVYMDKSEEKKEEELLAVEKQSVQVLKNTFAGISEVKFNEAGKNNMTGSYGMYVTIKNDEGEEVSFSFIFWKEKNEIGSYIINDRAVQKEGSTKVRVHVIFSNNSEEEI